MKITLQYRPGVDDRDIEQVLNLLNPVLKGAKVREKHNHPPLKHIYITPRNADKSTK